MTSKEAESSAKPRVKRSRNRRLAPSVSNVESNTDVHDIAFGISSAVHRAISDFQAAEENPDTPYETLLRGSDNLLLTSMMARIGMKLLESVESAPPIDLENPQDR